ncbi:hypothetical protein [Candidatus Nitrotoga fabula]|uniref:hypothetical protein n=1 Tax=Candidatus Nitrotoga fabula TaxID=2182327 RepID=UPI001BB47384|nr:hypothetical protein [Candidatus Nitrotoga fabula]
MAFFLPGLEQVITRAGSESCPARPYRAGHLPSMNLCPGRRRNWLLFSCLPTVRRQILTCADDICHPENGNRVNSRDFPAGFRGSPIHSGTGATLTAPPLTGGKAV